MKTKPNDDQDDSRPVPCILYSTESFTDAGTRKSKAKKKKKKMKKKKKKWKATISFLQTFDQCLSSPWMIITVHSYRSKDTEVDGIRVSE